MRTLVITIDSAVNGDYPVNVYFDDGSAAWRTTIRASGTIAVALTRAPYPIDAAGNSRAPGGMVAFVQNQNRPDGTTFQTIGEYLWSLLNQGNIRTYLASIWRAHWRTNDLDPREGIRTILDLRDPDVQALPWELMIRQNVPLFTSKDNPVVRGPLDPDPTAPVSGLLLRVLVVIGSKPGDANVKAEEEIENLEDAARIFRREIDLRVEYPHSKNELSDLIKNFKPHVLHFTGHGGEVPRRGRSPIASLVFQDDSGGIWDWTAEEVPATLAVGAPRLAFLNACRTGAGITTDPHKILNALSAEFLNFGTAAVIAMQADIAGAAAAEFAGAAYAALARDWTLDVALAEARYKVRERSTDRRDWSLPSLTVGVDVTRVLPPRLPRTKEERDRLEATPEFVDIQAFVDRRVQRRLVDPMADPSQIEDVVIVSGPPSTGKTAMLLWFLEGCAWCGHAVKYVDLKRDRPGFLDVLEYIEQAETNPPSDLRQALPGDFNRVHQLAQVVRAGQPVAAGTPDNPIDSLFTAFRAAFVQSAQGKPLFLALDHIGSMDPDAFRNYLRPYLLEHIAQRRMRPLRLLLTCTPDDYTDLGLSRLKPATPIDVNNFAAAEFSALYREYLLCRKVPRAKIPPPPWQPNLDFRPQMLADLYELMRKHNIFGN